ncbi:B3 domain-containing transcription repressor VAL2-like [Silene latifolia]|uniref:B3 domain-containing transcription repressor VAL2-like n=1 Tax=Silene latifolia TaxID=37657 RepID=UPI003D787C09
MIARAAFNDGTFCDTHHRNETGWIQCGICENQVHCGCFMSLNAFDVSDTYGIICNECVKKESLQAPNAGASSSAPNPVDPSQLNGEVLPTNPGTAALNNVPQMPNSGLTLAFEKKLTSTDCNPVAGRLLLPKKYAEEYFPMPPGRQKMPITMKDVQGRTWYLNMRWWPHKKSRKYVLDGTRSCIHEMGWNVGDSLKFYRQFPSGALVMEHQKSQDGASTS